MLRVISLMFYVVSECNGTVAGQIPGCVISCYISGPRSLSSSLPGCPISGENRKAVWVCREERDGGSAPSVIAAASNSCVLGRVKACSRHGCVAQHHRGPLLFSAHYLSGVSGDPRTNKWYYLMTVEASYTLLEDAVCS